MSIDEFTEPSFDVSEGLENFQGKFSYNLQFNCLLCDEEVHLQGSSNKPLTQVYCEHCGVDYKVGITYGITLSNRETIKEAARKAIAITGLE